MPSKNLHPRNASTTCPRAPGSPLPYPTTMSSIFTSIEFYITALAVAVAIIAFFGSSDDTPRASSDIYTPTTQAERVNATPSVILRAMPDGTIEITRQGLTLHGNCSIYINAEFIKDRITLTEKIALPHAPCPTKNTSSATNLPITPCGEPPGLPTMADTLSPWNLNHSTSSRYLRPAMNFSSCGVAFCITQNKPSSPVAISTKTDA